MGKRNRNSIRDRLTGGLTTLLVRFLNLPPNRYASAFGGLSGRVIVLASPKLRRRIATNLEYVFPQMDAAEKRRIGMKVGVTFGRTFAELLTNRRFHAAGHWRAPKPSPGIDALRRAAAEGGAVIVTGHFGQWEAGRAWMRSLGIACAGVYRAIDNPHLNRIYVGQLEAAGAPVFAKGRRGMRKLVRHISTGGLAAILTDQYDSAAEPLDFIGRPAPTALTAAELALRYKIPLIPVYGIRDPSGPGVQVVVEAPIPHSTAREMMAAVNGSLAEQIRAAPGQYYWLHRRWKKGRAARRDGEA